MRRLLVGQQILNLICLSANALQLAIISTTGDKQKCIYSVCVFVSHESEEALIQQRLERQQQMCDENRKRNSLAFFPYWQRMITERTQGATLKIQHTTINNNVQSDLHRTWHEMDEINWRVIQEQPWFLLH